MHLLQILWWSGAHGLADLALARPLLSNPLIDYGFILCARYVITAVSFKLGFCAPHQLTNFLKQSFENQLKFVALVLLLYHDIRCQLCIKLAIRFSYSIRN